MLPKNGGGAEWLYALINEAGNAVCGDWKFGGGLSNSFNLTYNDVFSPYSNPYTNTWLSTQNNFTMEVIAQSGSVVNARFYITNPLEGKPSKPQNLQVAASAGNHPELTWEANTEPDKSYYKIYKYTTYEVGWQFLGVASTPYYQDISVSYCGPGQYCPEHTVRYRVSCMDTQNKESIPSDSVMTSVRGYAEQKIDLNHAIVDIQKEYNLSANYPNPFNPSTIIKYAIKEAGLVKIKVFDILGCEVAELVNETKEAGNFLVEFNAANLPSGVYIYTMQVNEYGDSKKMMLMK